MDSSTTYPASTNRVFYGPMGLRAGWGLLLYLAVIATIIVGVNVVHHNIRTHQKQAQVEAHRLNPQVPLPPKPDPNAPQPLQEQIFIDGTAVIVFLLLTAFLSQLERRRVGVYGLGGNRPLPRFLNGAFWGLAAITLLIVTLNHLHYLSFDARLLHGPMIFFWATAQFLTFFLVALAEEYFFRGYLQFTLTRGLLSLGKSLSSSHTRAAAFWLAAAVTSAFFCLAHSSNGGETHLGLLQVFLYALVCTFALWRTGSLWWAIGFHTVWDWSQSFLYGVPDSGGLLQGRLFATHAAGSTLYSGGTVGPEGSILIIPLLLLVLLVLYFTHPSPQPPLEQDAALLQTESRASAS